MKLFLGLDLSSKEVCLGSEEKMKNKIIFATNLFSEGTNVAAEDRRSLANFVKSEELSYIINSIK